MGVPAERVLVMAYDAPDPRAPVLAGFETLRAHVPNCAAVGGAGHHPQPRREIAQRLVVQRVDDQLAGVQPPSQPRVGLDRDRVRQMGHVGSPMWQVLRDVIARS